MNASRFLRSISCSRGDGGIKLMETCSFLSGETGYALFSRHDFLFAAVLFSVEFPVLKSSPNWRASGTVSGAASRTVNRRPPSGSSSSCCLPCPWLSRMQGTAPGKTGDFFAPSRPPALERPKGRHREMCSFSRLSCRACMGNMRYTREKEMGSQKRKFNDFCHLQRLSGFFGVIGARDVSGLGSQAPRVRTAPGARESRRPARRR